jgi:hypothetical protein
MSGNLSDKDRTMPKQIYTSPEMLELGNAAVLTLGSKGCDTDCEDCDLPKETEIGVAFSAS